MTDFQAGMVAGACLMMAGVLLGALWRTRPRDIDGLARVADWYPEEVARVAELEGALDRLCREVGNYTRATGTSAATEDLSHAYMDGLEALHPHPQETE